MHPITDKCILDARCFEPWELEIWNSRTPSPVEAELVVALRFFAYPGDYEGRPTREQAVATARELVDKALHIARARPKTEEG